MTAVTGPAGILPDSLLVQGFTGGTMSTVDLVWWRRETMLAAALERA